MDKLFVETEEGFSGKYSFLSNMYEVDLVYSSRLMFSSSEGIYQYIKALHVSEELANKVANSKNGYQAKRLLKPYTSTLSTDIKLNAMQFALDRKFEKEEMKEQLLSTDDIELVEYNWWNDKFWGVCKGEGKNVLGIMLMTKRRNLRAK